MVFIPTDGHGYYVHDQHHRRECMKYNENIATSSPGNPVRIRTGNASDKSLILKAAYNIIHALKSKKNQKKLVCNLLDIYCIVC